MNIKTINELAEASKLTDKWSICADASGKTEKFPLADIINPIYRVIDNKLNASYDGGVTFEPVSDYIASYFRWSDNNIIQMSHDQKTWTDLSGSFTNNMFIKGYVDTPANLPSKSTETVGSIYMVGSQPPYDMYVLTSTGWTNNGAFQSLTAGVVNETGTSENLVMSQKAVTDKFTELESRNSELKFAVLGKVPYEIYQVNAGADPSITDKGNRLRLIVYTKANVRYKAQCTIGKGASIGICANMHDALLASPYLQTIHTFTTEEVKFTTGVEGYLVVSLSKEDDSAISASEKEEFLTNVVFEGLDNLGMGIDKLDEKVANVSRDVRLTAVKEKTNRYMAADGTANHINIGESFLISINRGDAFKMTSNLTHNTNYCFLKSNFIPNEGEKYDICEGFSRVVVPLNTTIEEVAPNDAKWVLISTQSDLYSHMPQCVSINGYSIIMEVGEQEIIFTKENEKNITLLGERTSELEFAVLGKVPYEIYQVNAGADPSTTDKGNRLRLIVYTKANVRYKAQCTIGKGAAIGVYANMHDALLASPSLQTIHTFTTEEVKFTTGVEGYLVVSLSKEDDSAISASEKEEFLTNVVFEGLGSGEIEVKGLSNAFAMQKKFTNQHKGNDNYSQYATIVHLTDTHGDAVRVERAYQVASLLGAIVVVSGDIVYYHSADDVEWFNKITNTYNVPTIICMGNHDTWEFGYESEVYNKYILPHIDKQNWAFPNNVEYPTYFSYDDINKKLRFISVNQWQCPNEDVTGLHYYTKYHQEQINWLIETLLSTPSDYGVFLVVHSPENAMNVNPQYAKFFVGETSGEMSSPVEIKPLYEIIDAYIGRNSLRKTFTSANNSFLVNADFASANGEFIAFISGHIHKDYVCYDSLATNKQLILNETCTNAWINKNIDGSDGGENTNNPYLNEISDLARQMGTENQDAFNVYVVDRDKKEVRIVRLGNDLPVSSFEKRDYMVIPYV